MKLLVFFLGTLFVIFPGLLVAEEWVEPLDAKSLLMKNQSSYPEQYEALYLRRFGIRFLGEEPSEGAPGLGGYDPLADVLGARPFVPIPAASASQNTISTGALDAAEAYASQRNSLALIVWRKGRVERASYFGDTSKDSLIVSGSLAKPLSVIAIGRAIHEGYIKSLDQPVSDYLPEWKESAKAGILVRHLLEMRSGLLPQSFDVEPEHIINRAYLHPAHEEIIINDYPIVHEPGSRYEYSNVSLDLVAPLIERATGIKYEDWLSQKIIMPLGAKGGQVWVNRPNGMAHSACCALLPAETYLRLALLVLFDGVWNGQELISLDFVRDMKTPTAQNSHAGMGLYIGSPYKERRGPLNPETNFGTILHSEPYAADDLVLFDGNSNQVAYIVPSEELVILRVGNWPGKGKEWDNSYLPNVILRGIEGR